MCAGGSSYLHLTPLRLATHFRQYASALVQHCVRHYPGPDTARIMGTNLCEPSATARMASPGSPPLICSAWLTVRAPRHRRAMGGTSQLEYLAAVKCLMAKPATGQQFFPPVQSRYDDCAAMHINATQGACLSPRVLCIRGLTPRSL